jgi:NADH dehydrogenase FAD-containing subunit
VTFAGTSCVLFDLFYILNTPLQLDLSDIQGAVSSTTISYDYLVYAVGAEVQTFGIPGVTEHACFMKELPDAEKVGLLSAFQTIY